MLLDTVTFTVDSVTGHNDYNWTQWLFLETVNVTGHNEYYWIQWLLLYKVNVTRHNDHYLIQYIATVHSKCYSAQWTYVNNDRYWHALLPRALGGICCWWWWWWCRASCPRMSVDILGTNCDQCVSMVQYCFTSTETIRLVRTESPGRPPWLSHSSWTLNSEICWWCWLLFI